MIAVEVWESKEGEVNADRDEKVYREFLWNLRMLQIKEWDLKSLTANLTDGNNSLKPLV